jgi:hypothetical protein
MSRNDHIAFLQRSSSEEADKSRANAVNWRAMRRAEVQHLEQHVSKLVGPSEIDRFGYDRRFYHKAPFRIERAYIQFSSGGSDVGHGPFDLAVLA